MTIWQICRSPKAKTSYGLLTSRFLSLARIYANKTEDDILCPRPDVVQKLQKESSNLPNASS